jgi:hypothetical protein
MADYDLYNGGIVHQLITAERAREIYEQAAADPDSDLDGDLETGFHYWTKSTDGLELVRHHVMPRQDDEPSGPSLPPGNM